MCRGRNLQYLLLEPASLRNENCQRAVKVSRNTIYMNVSALEMGSMCSPSSTFKVAKRPEAYSGVGFAVVPTTF